MKRDFEPLLAENPSNPGAEMKAIETFLAFRPAFCGKSNPGAENGLDRKFAAQSRVTFGLALKAY